MTTSATRLDAFTDAAFAFAVSLLVIGGAAAPRDLQALAGSLSDIPAFAIGFALMAMFWWAHVSWRKLRGETDGAWSVLLTLLLVFLTLIYVQPLRAMAAAMAVFFTGQGEGFRGALGPLFIVYGTGFVAMALTMAALFHDASRRLRAGPRRGEARGNLAIWLILAGTGFATVLVSFTPFAVWAATLYATLPITIGIFSSLHDWDDVKSTSRDEARDGEQEGPTPA